MRENDLLISIMQSLSTVRQLARKVAGFSDAISITESVSSRADHSPPALDRNVSSRGSCRV